MEKAWEWEAEIYKQVSCKETFMRRVIFLLKVHGCYYLAHAMT